MFNYSSISLLPNAYTVLTGVLCERLKSLVKALNTITNSRLRRITYKCDLQKGCKQIRITNE